MKRNSRRLSRGVAAGVVVAAASLFCLPSTTASAYFNDSQPSCIVTDTIDWKFEYGGFPDAKKNTVRSAFNTIEQALDYDGTRLVDLNESNGLYSTRVWANDNPPAGGYGHAICGNNMWINNNIAADKFIWHVARHEMMHLLQAAHGGRADSVASGEDPTTMSTCVNHGELRNENTLDRDAEAYLNWLHSDLSYRQINTNIGFDNGTKGWGGTNGTLVTSAANGFSSPPHGVFYAAGTSSDSFVRQTIRLWVGDDIGDFEVRAYLRARAPSSSTNTNVRATIYRKNMSESGDNICWYPRGLQNPNNPTVSTMDYVVVTQSALVSVDTTWTAVASGWASIPVARDGYQLQLRAYGNAAGSSAVRFDNVRMEER